MKRQLRFVQGRWRRRPRRWDSTLVAGLERALGADYEIRFPPMPNEASPRRSSRSTAEPEGGSIQGVTQPDPFRGLWRRATCACHCLLWRLVPLASTVRGGLVVSGRTPTVHSGRAALPPLDSSVKPACRNDSLLMADILLFAVACGARRTPIFPRISIERTCNSSWLPGALSNQRCGQRIVIASPRLDLQWTPQRLRLGSVGRFGGRTVPETSIATWSRTLHTQAGIRTSKHRRPDTPRLICA